MNPERGTQALDEERREDVVVMRPGADFWQGGEETDRFLRRAQELAAGGCRGLVVNLARFNRLTSLSAGAIADAWKTFHGRGARLIVCCASKEILLMFKLTRLEGVLTLCASESEALALLESSPAP